MSDPKLILFIGLLLWSCSTHAQEKFTTGNVVEKLTIEAQKTQSYSLYLPSKFDGKTKLPIVYVFDPAARGKTAVEVFVQAAEKYGYIVVGSNDSRNGLGGDQLTPIFNNLWEDTHRRLPIDDSRVVMAGLSGGARVASIFANSCKCAFAVIGSGAGFSQTVDQSGKLPFIYFGTAGYDDLNYFELRSLSAKLFASRNPYRLEYFDGPHQWMPASMAETALAWVELQAMRANRRPVDAAFIDQEFQLRMRNAEALLASYKPIEAEAAFRSVAVDFAGLKDTSAAVEKMNSIAASTEFKKALKAERDEAADYERRSRELFGLAQGLVNAETRQDVLGQIRSIADGVRRHSEAKDDSASRRTARRLLDGTYIAAVETASATVRSGRRIIEALNMLELADAMRPKNAYVSFLRAQLFALDGQKGRALDTLSKAVDLGLKNRQLIENEKTFEKIRKESEFQKILSRLDEK